MSAVADQPLVASTAAQHLAASVSAAFPSTALTEPTGSDRQDARPAALRRALAHIEDHADRPVTVAEIAAAAHVTVRALQYAFRRHLDTTPLAHLRRVRLSHAHRDLLAADPGEGATVTDIAARWGFHHPGRFAAVYRDCYGHSPHRTAPHPARLLTRTDFGRGPPQRWPSGCKTTFVQPSSRLSKCSYADGASSPFALLLRSA